MIFRNYVTLALIFSFICSSACGQSKEDFTKRLNDIKTKYSTINQYKSYYVITIDDAEAFLGNSVDNGASLTGYFKGDTLVKIVESIGLSNKVLQNEYYLDEDKLFFVYATESNYEWNDSMQVFDYTKLKLHFSARYYFENGKLFDTILSDKNATSLTQNTAATFTSSIKKYISLLTKDKNKSR